jgi:hypothetical protein
MPGRSFRRLFGNAPVQKPRIAFLAAIRAGKEKIVKEEFRKATPSGSVDERALAVRTCLSFSGELHDNLSYSGLGTEWYTQAS